jgi:hypothetical protein
MEMKVIRTDTDHIRANGKWFRRADLVDKVFTKLKAAGSDNPALDAPPWFYSGSPYADAICALGCAEVEAPKKYSVEYVPALGEVWRARKPAWPEIFGVAEVQP